MDLEHFDGFLSLHHVNFICGSFLGETQPLENHRVCVCDSLQMNFMGINSCPMLLGLDKSDDLLDIMQYYGFYHNTSVKCDCKKCAWICSSSIIAWFGDVTFFEHLFYN